MQVCCRTEDMSFRLANKLVRVFWPAGVCERCSRPGFAYTSSSESLWKRSFTDVCSESLLKVSPGLVVSDLAAEWLRATITQAESKGG